MIHERDTAGKLAGFGFDVKFLLIDRRPNTTNPDVEVQGRSWEMKSPKGSSVKNTISEQFKSAKRQSENLIIDLVRSGVSDEIAIEQIKRRFYGQSRYKRLIVLDRKGNLLYFSRERVTLNGRKWPLPH